MATTLAMGIDEQQLGTVTLTDDNILTIDGPEKDRLTRILTTIRRQTGGKRLNDARFFDRLQRLNSTHMWTKLIR